MAIPPSTSLTKPIPSSSTAVALNGPSIAITLVNQSGSAILYFNFNDSTLASSSNFGILPGDRFEYCGPPVSVVNIIGSSPSGNYCLFANGASQ